MASIAESHRSLRDGSPVTYFTAYLGINPITKKKIRFEMKDRFALVRRIEQFYATERRVGESFIAIRPDEAFDARAALEVLRSAGVAKSLHDIAVDYVERVVRERALNDTALEDALAEYIESFPEVQDKHRGAIRQRVGSFVSAFGPRELCRSVEAKDVTDYLARFDVAKTYNGALGYIKSFFNWCAAPERKFVESNPIALLKARPIAHKDPLFMTPEDVERLFRHFEESGERPVLAYMTLAFLCGIRLEEIKRLADDDELVSVDAESVRIKMPKGWTRGMRPRMVPLTDNAAAWIRAYDLGEALHGSSVAYSATRMHEEAEKIGVAIPRNAGRHTFITMHVAAFHNEQVTQTICGTSKGMLVQNYMGLATKAQGRAYFAMMPKGVDGASGMCENAAVAGEGKPDPVLN